jgi:hypothetical protein
MPAATELGGRWRHVSGIITLDSGNSLGLSWTNDSSQRPGGVCVTTFFVLSVYHFSRSGPCYSSKADVHLLVKRLLDDSEKREKKFSLRFIGRRTSRPTSLHSLCTARTPSTTAPVVCQVRTRSWSQWHKSKVRKDPAATCDNLLQRSFMGSFMALWISRHMSLLHGVLIFLTHTFLP